MRRAFRRRLQLPIFVAAVTIAVLACVILLRTPSSGEPSYRGHGLTWWLRRAANGDPDGRQAIREIGTNSLPFLIRQLKWRDSVPRSEAYRIADSAGLRLNSLSGLDRHVLSYVGFKELGPVGRPAIPCLLALANDTNTSSIASQSLAALGPEGVRALGSVLTNSDWRIRSDAATGLGAATSEKDFCLNELVRATEDSNYVVRWAAARAIGFLRTDSVLGIDALIDCTTDTNRAVRSGALEALGSLGQSARRALDAIRRATNDPEPIVRSAAISALSKVDVNDVRR